MESGIVFDIQRFSIHDGPGIRTTVFLKGCPLSCWWCHNPESQSTRPELMFREHRCIRCGSCLTTCPEDAISKDGDAVLTDLTKCTVCGDCVQVCQTEAREIVGREMTVEQVMQEIEKDVAFYDESRGGVTFSGGEPLMQAPFLVALLRACREREIRSAVDTSGLASWKTLERVADLADLFLYDLKLIDETRHRNFTGVSNELILSNLRALARNGRSVAVRMPLIPGINDDEHNLEQLARFVLSLDHPPQVSLLPYHKAGADKYARLHKPYALGDTEPPTEERATELADRLQGYGLTVRIGG
ncbi:MAG: glycyl-radical enzyme activating protein [Chloroflexi bacterium]|nr:glycyl-radical enzyme activating protein [Chloroflexota bacterium]